MTRHLSPIRSRRWLQRPLLAAAALAVLLTAAVDGLTTAAPGQQGSLTPVPKKQGTAEDTQAVAEFRKRCEAYVALHKKIEAGLPKLPENATPEQIEKALVGLSQGIVAARAGAKQGDIFVPGAQDYLRSALMAVFKERDGKQVRSSILDENPIGAPVKINGPYPDAIPLSTMPPQVLTALPKLPEELEYRFIGDRLILFDHHAHLIVDYVDKALPVV
jgi:hypothetical protein